MSIFEIIGYITLCSRETNLERMVKDKILRKKNLGSWEKKKAAHKLQARFSLRLHQSLPFVLGAGPSPGFQGTLSHSELYIEFANHLASLLQLSFCLLFCFFLFLPFFFATEILIASS